MKTKNILYGLALALVAPVQAQNIVGSTSSSSSWLGTSVFQTGSTPTGGSGGTTLDNNSWGGDANGTGGFGALGMAFVVSSSGTLANVQLVMAGAAATFNVELYDMGPAPATFPSGSPSGSNPGGAPAITQINNIGGGPPGGSPPTISGGVNLLQSGDQFIFYGVASGNTLETLTFQNADANVHLVTGELYVLSLDPTANADNTWWERGGLPVAGYNLGEGLNADGVAGMLNFEGKTSIRDFDLAITLVPVPPLGIAAAGKQAVLYWPASGTNLILQTTTNLSAPNWVAVTNGTPIIGVTLTNTSPAAFFRLSPN